MGTWRRGGGGDGGGLFPKAKEVGGWEVTTHPHLMPNIINTGNKPAFTHT